MEVILKEDSYKIKCGSPLQFWR